MSHKPIIVLWVVSIYVCIMCKSMRAQGSLARMLTLTCRQTHNVQHQPA